MQQDPSNFKCPYIHKHRIWEIADAFRSEHWPTGRLPIDVESIAEKRLKLDIVPQHGLFADYDIDAWLKMDLILFRVQVDTNDPGKTCHACH
jgi:hypothetical protein